MATMMLASLISTLFALPAQAAAGQIDFNVTSSVPKVLPSAAYSYTVTITNNSTVDADTLAFTDTLTGGGTMTAATPSVGGLCSAPVANVTNCSFPTLVNLASATVTINATAPAIPGTATNTVSAFTDTQLDAANGTLFANTTVENADLVVTKAHAGVTTPGGALTYTITVHNNGPSDATNVTLNDSAPANVTFGIVTVASAPAGVSTCLPAPTTASIACAGWTIPNGMTVTVTVAATLAAGVGVGTAISNTASVSTATLDSVAANNSATDAFVVGLASVDLGVTIAVAPASAAPGDTVTYTVTVTNPDIAIDATNVVVTDVLPTDLTPVSPPATPTVGVATVAGNTWTWTIPTVAKATSVTATFDAVVDPATLLTTITNTVTMTATEIDPTPENNTASVDLTVAAAVADLDVLTAVDNSKPKQGDQIQIAIQVSNVGPDDATNVVLKDVLPKGLKYVSCSPCNPSGLRRSTSQQFSIGSIPADTAATLILTVTVQASSGTLKNTASIVSADQSDPLSSNDKDTLQITIAGTSSSGGSGSGGTSSGGTSSGTSGGTSGTTAFTGFTAGQLMPWFLLLATLGLAAMELARRKTLVSPVGFTYGFDPFV